MNITLTYTTDANNENKNVVVPSEAVDIINANRKRYRLGAFNDDGFSIITSLRQILKNCEFTARRVKVKTGSGFVVSFTFGNIEEAQFVNAFIFNRSSMILDETCLDNAADAWKVLTLVSNANN